MTTKVTQRHERRALTTRYAEWALDDAAAELMEDPSVALGLPAVVETVSEKKAAALLGMTAKSLADRRHRGTGPKVTLFLGKPAYRHEDIGAWAERNQL